jgi:exodeoxyribonuclease VII small subunit
MENLTYEAAFKELQEISDEIERESVSIDVLADKVKRASELIAFCQSKLRDTETEVNNIIRQIEVKPAESGI